MAISDLATNPIDPNAISFLGFRTSDKPPFPHDLYSFIIEGVRRQDQECGNQLILRWLAAAQSEWEDTQDRIRSLLDLYDPAQAPADALPFVKWLVGFTGKTDFVTESATEADLRRLISIAVAMWKIKGTDSGFVLALQAISTRLVRVANYFQFLQIVDEVEIAREELGFDPWLVDSPGFSPGVAPDLVTDLGSPPDELEFDINGLLGTADESGHDIRVQYVPTKTIETVTSYYSGGTNKVVTSYLGQSAPPSTNVGDYRVGVDPDEFASDIRMMDDGNVDRALVEDLVELLRPAGERYYIRFLDFHDNFRGTFYWTLVSGDYIQDTDAGTIDLEDGASDSVIITDETNDNAWTEMYAAVQFNLRDSADWGELRFYYNSEDDFYALRIEPATKTVKLDKVTASVRTTLDSTVLATYFIGENYWFSVQTQDTGAGHELKYFLDGNLLGSAVDTDHTSGKIGLASATGQRLRATLVEVFQFPLDSVRVGPV